MLPTAHRIVVELFPDEMGDEMACLLSPFGGRVNVPWALAIEEVLAKDGYKTRAVWSDEGAAFRMPEGFTASLEDVIVLAGHNVQDLVTASLSSSPLLLNTFRECAARALLFSKRGPLARVPLWLQRQEAEELLYVARSIDGFPILAETYREILADSFDLAGLDEVFSSLQKGKMCLEIRQTPTASPFSASMTFGYVANFIYESSAPLAETRAIALGLDRSLLSDLLGEAEGGNLPDPDVTREVENELQRIKKGLQAEDAGDLQALLRLLGDLSGEEVRQRISPRVSYSGLMDELISTRRAVWIQIGGEPRLILSSEAGMYRDALGVQPPSGLSSLSLESPSRPLERILRRAVQRRSSFTQEYLKTRFFLDDLSVSEYLNSAVEQGELVVTEIDGRPGVKSWVARDVLRRIRLLSLAKARSEVEAVSSTTLANYFVEYQGVSSPRIGQPGLTAVLGQIAGMEMPPDLLERELLPSRVDGYSGAMLDLALSSGEFAWLGTLTQGGEERVVKSPARLSSLPRMLFLDAERARFDTLEVWESVVDEKSRLEARLNDLGSAYFSDLAPEAAKGIAERTSVDALWRLVFEGKVHNDSFAAYRAWRKTRGRRDGNPRLAPGRHRGRLNLSSLSWSAGRTPPSAAGRWTWIGAGPAGDGELNLYEIASAISRWGFLSRSVAGAEGYTRRISRAVPPAQ